MTGAADSLMDALVHSLDVPRERIVEFWLHRTRRGKSIVTIRFDATDVAGPPLQHAYELTQIPDATGHPPTRTRDGRLDTVTSDLPRRPQRRFTLRRNNDG